MYNSYQPHQSPPPQQQQQQPSAGEDRRLEYRGGYSCLPANAARRAENQRVAEAEARSFGDYVASHRPEAFTRRLGGGGGDDRGGGGDDRGGGGGNVPDRRNFLKRKEEEIRQRTLTKYARATAGHAAAFGEGGRVLGSDGSEPIRGGQQQQRDSMKQANAAFLARVANSSSTSSLK